MSARTRRLLGIVLAAVVAIAALFGVVVGGDDEAPRAEVEGTGDVAP